MSPELYFAVMLITNPQKTRRILLAEELENWFMDLFDDEYEDILEGTFRKNQDSYIERIVDKYLEITNVNITDTDEYTKSVIDKAYKTATEIQETTWKNLVTIPLSKGEISETELADFILGGVVLGTTIFNTDRITRWLGKQRANLIALNEANWKWNNEEFFDAKEGNKTKIWHTALDEKVRMTHIALEGVEIPVNDYFDVGGYQALYPMADTLPPSEVLNCRCTLEYKK